jgi:hypothetical protein
MRWQGPIAKFDELYYYDGLHRLTVFGRGELNSNNDGFTSSVTLAQAWTLDATGNWKGFDQVMANPFTTPRAHNTVNEITGITIVSGSPTWDNPPCTTTTAT